MREEEKRKVGGGVKQKGRKGTNERTNERVCGKNVSVCVRERSGRERKKKGERREGKGKRIRKQRRGSSFSVEMVALLAHTSDRGRFNIGWHRLV